MVGRGAAASIRMPEERSMRAFRHIVILVLALLATSGAMAATRIWALTGVMFDDGAVATGQFTYDDVTGVLGGQNIHVTDGPFYLSFTYIAGNSIPLIGISNPQPTFTFRSPEGGGEDVSRDFRITPVSALDGTLSPVPINLATSGNRSGSIECYNCSFARFIIAGSLTQVFLPPPVAIVIVDEFYNTGLDHYFITANPAEKMDLDTGVHPGWMRTGQSFKAYAAGSSASGSINPVCRYYGNPSAGLDSHFYSASARECFEVHAKFPAAWGYESDNVFQIALPDDTTGECPASTVPVYRVWNNRADSNHRYTASLATRDAMVAMGYVKEGYGPNFVIMCAVP
jgi:hypothetical protein